MADMVVVASDVLPGDVVRAKGEAGGEPFDVTFRATVVEPQGDKIRFEGDVALPGGGVFPADSEFELVENPGKPASA